MKQSYGTTKIKQIELSEAEVIRILIENLDVRGMEHYNFDVKRPVVVKQEKGGYIFRYFTKDMKEDGKPREMNLKQIVSCIGGRNDN